MNYEAFAAEHHGKSVHVVMIDEDEYDGIVCGFIPEYDNDPDPESIMIRVDGIEIELYTNEIDVIELSL